MRLLSYNILDGGENRFDLLRDVIQSQNADIVCLVEADDPAVVQRLARALSMDFVHAPGNRKASALLSRWTIRSTINHAPQHPELEKSLLEAGVIEPGGREWIIGVVHLHHQAYEQDERIRQEEIGSVLEIFRRHRDVGRPHLLAGDFNSNAPDQQIDPARCKPSTRSAWEKNGGYVPRRVVQRILNEGYLDSLHTAHPQSAKTAATFTTEFPGQRVDYIFTSAIAQDAIKDAWIVTAPPAAQASDHFAIGAQIA